jgi:hypothetical protein
LIYSFVKDGGPEPTPTGGEVIKKEETSSNDGNFNVFRFRKSSGTAFIQNIPPTVQGAQLLGRLSKKGDIVSMGWAEVTYGRNPHMEVIITMQLEHQADRMVTNMHNRKSGTMRMHSSRLPFRAEIFQNLLLIAYIPDEKNIRELDARLRQDMGQFVTSTWPKAAKVTKSPFIAGQNTKIREISHIVKIPTLRTFKVFRATDYRVDKFRSEYS